MLFIYILCAFLGLFIGNVISAGFGFFPYKSFVDTPVIVRDTLIAIAIGVTAYILLEK